MSRNPKNPSAAQKSALLCISVAYILTAVYINIPIPQAKKLITATCTIFPSGATPLIKKSEYQLRKISHIFGVDNIWRMFSTISKEHWTLTTQTTYEPPLTHLSQIRPSVPTNISQEIRDHLYHQLLTLPQTQKNFLEYQARQAQHPKPSSISLRYLGRPLEKAQTSVKTERLLSTLKKPPRENFNRN